MIVEVFKTNVCDPVHAEGLLLALIHSMQLFRATFDLDDCDRVLRVEGNCVCVESVSRFLSAQGFQCTLLDE